MISILLTIKDRQDYFERQLKYFDVNLKSIDIAYEVIIYDDGSEVPLFKVNSDIEYKLVRSDKNLGLIQARNELSKLVDLKSKYLLFLDDDIFIHNFHVFIVEAVSALETESNLAAVSCPYINLPTHKREEISTFKTILNLDKKDEFTVYFFGGTSIFKKDIFEKFNGLEGLYKIYLEEEDLALRMFDKDFFCRILYGKNTIAIHDQAPGKDFKERNLYLLSNRLIYHYKFIGNDVVRMFLDSIYKLLYFFKMKDFSLFKKALIRVDEIKPHIVRNKIQTKKFIFFMSKRYFGR